MEPQTYWDMFWGYAAIWGLLAAFIIKMQFTQSRLDSRLRELESKRSSL